MAASVKTLSKINANAYAENFRGGRVTLNYTVPPEGAANEVATEVCWRQCTRSDEDTDDVVSGFRTFVLIAF